MLILSVRIRQTRLLDVLKMGGRSKMHGKDNTEWKEFGCNEYLKWICNFVNGQGGKIDKRIIDL